MRPTLLAVLLSMAATGAPPAEGSNDPGTVWVTSSPVGAEVRLDGVVAGRTPIAVTIPAGGKHQLTVSQQGWSTFQRSLTRPAKRLELEARLKDLELEKAEAALKKARSAFDKANERLEAAVAGSAANDVDRDPKVVKAQQAVQVAENDVVNAETAVATVKNSRLSPEERAARVKEDRRLADEAAAVKARVAAERGGRLFKCHGNGTAQSISSNAGNNRTITTTTRTRIYCATVATQDQARSACEKENRSNGCTCTEAEGETGACAAYVR